MPDGVWRTGCFRMGRHDPIRSTLAHFYDSPLHVVAACGTAPNAPLTAEDPTMPGARRCVVCRRKEPPSRSKGTA